MSAYILHTILIVFLLSDTVSATSTAKDFEQIGCKTEEDVTSLLTTRTGLHRRKANASTTANGVRMTVTLNGGIDLKDMDWLPMDDSDPFCRIWLVDGENATKTPATFSVDDGFPRYKYGWESPVAKTGGNHPKWDYTFATSSWEPGDWLEFKCWDKDIDPSRVVKSLNGDDFMGEAKLMLGKHGGTNLHNVNIPLSLKGKPAGKLIVTVSFFACKGDCETLPAAMAMLAEAVYERYTQAGSWKMIFNSVLESSGQHDIIGIYKQTNNHVLWRKGANISDQADQREKADAIFKSGKSRCALAFSGSNDRGDWGNNLQASATSLCGWSKVHSGFADETKGYMRDPKAAEWTKIIAEQCGGEVITVGHSLGGAVASIVAACANNKKLAELSGSVSITPFTVSALYTIGAPSVSQDEPLSNKLGDGDGCFAGLRSFNADPLRPDPVPFLASVVGYLHPRVDSLKLTEEGRTSISCADKTEIMDPAPPKNAATFLDRILRAINAGAEMHGCVHYVSRIAKYLAGLKFFW